MKIRIECYVSDRPGLHCHVYEIMGNRLVVSAKLSQVLSTARSNRLEIVNGVEVLQWLNDHVSFISKASDREDIGSSVINVI